MAAYGRGPARAPKMGGIYAGGATPPQRPAQSSTPAQVRERKLGDLFEYEIEHPVTIRRNQSALVPIVLRAFEGRPVLLHNSRTRRDNPMRCVELKNTTGLTLEGGPVTVDVFADPDGGLLGSLLCNLAGGIDLDDINPGQLVGRIDRLIDGLTDLADRLDGIERLTRPIERLIDRGVHLEVCPTSNVLIGIYPSLADHPVDRLYRAGVSMGISTDCRGVLPITLEDEARRLAETFGWREEHLRRLNLRAVEACFAAPAVKVDLARRIEGG